MTTLEDIEKAVAELPTDQLAKFRAWFDEFEAARFDLRMGFTRARFPHLSIPAAIAI